MYIFTTDETILYCHIIIIQSLQFTLSFTVSKIILFKTVLSGISTESLHYSSEVSSKFPFLPVFLTSKHFIWVPAAAAAAAKSLQSCPTLCDPIDGSPLSSPIPGILQARTLEWVAISFSNAWKWKVKMKSLSHVRLLATPRTAAYQAPPSMGFSRQEYWSGVIWVPTPQ